MNHINHGYTPQITAAYAKLPQSAREIIGVIGEPAALVLFEKLGGTRFPMVKGNTKMGLARLAVLGDFIGDALAEKLCKHYGETEELYVPLCTDALRFVRDLCIKQGFDELVRQQGSSIVAVNTLVGQYRLSDRTIWRILKTPDVLESEQEGLF